MIDKKQIELLVEKKFTALMSQKKSLAAVPPITKWSNTTNFPVIDLPDTPYSVMGLYAGGNAKFPLTSPILGVDNCISGANMTLDKSSVPGSIIFASSGGSGSTTPAAQCSFDVKANTTHTATGPGGFTPIVVDPSAFTARVEINTNAAIFSIASTNTPGLQSTLVGARNFNVEFFVSLKGTGATQNQYLFTLSTWNGSFSTDTTYISVADLDSTTAEFTVPVGGIISLSQNDLVFVSVKNLTTPSADIIITNCVGKMVDTTINGLADSDQLTQGANHWFLTQNGGVTYQNISGSLIVGNLVQANTTGGQLIDSGIAQNNVVLASTDQTISGFKAFTAASVLFQPGLSGGFTSILGSTHNIRTSIGDHFDTTYTAEGNSGASVCMTESSGINYDDPAGSSGFFLQAILNKGSLSYLHRLVGANATQGTRVLWGNDSGASKIDNFSINTSYLANPYLGALVEVASTTQGTLLSRMTNAQMNAVNVSDTPTSLLLYTTDSTVGFKYWDGVWNTVLSNANVTGDVIFSASGIGTIADNAITPSKVSNDEYSIDINGVSTFSSRISTLNSSTAASFYLLAAPSSSTSFQEPVMCPGIYLNPNTNAITATTFIGALTGNADTATIASGASAGSITNAMLAGSIDLASKVTGNLLFANGGFGFNTATTGDLFYASAANTPGKLADVATGQVLTSGGIGAAPAYSATPTLSQISLGAAQTQAITTAFSSRGANSTIANSAAWYSAADQYPVIQVSGYAHTNNFINFDAYFDGANYRGSVNGSAAQIAKTSTALVINYSGGVTQGTTMTWSSALSINSLAGGVTAPVSLSTPLITLTGATSELQMANGGQMLAKNSGGTYEGFMFPRFSDNKMYIDIGSAGLVWRQNGGTTAFTMDNLGNVTYAQGDVSVGVAGKGYNIKGGSNARIGTATLVAGTVTVTNTSVLANDYISVTYRTISGATGVLVAPISSITAGSGFVINSLTAGGLTVNISDVSTVQYVIDRAV